MGVDRGRDFGVGRLGSLGWMVLVASPARTRVRRLFSTYDLRISLLFNFVALVSIVLSRACTFGSFGACTHLPTSWPFLYLLSKTYTPELIRLLSRQDLRRLTYVTIIILFLRF